MSTPKTALAAYTTLGVGGPADHFVRATSEAEIIEALRFAAAGNLPVFPLGGGSNVVVADEGVRGLVLSLATRGLDFEELGDRVRVTARAGEPWDDFVGALVDENLAGLECLSGIPGLVGATPIQNVGAYGQEVSEVIESVRVVDRTSFEVRTLDHRSCEFAYRDSYFKRAGAARFVVLDVTYRLRRGADPHLGYAELKQALEPRAKAPTLAETRATVVELRRRKSMVLDPGDENGRSCGSFFVNARVTADDLARIERGGANPPRFAQEDGCFKVPSAWLIEQAGLAKGTRRGQVGLSTKHCLALVAHDGATARDVVDFAGFVRRRVEERFGVTLIPEPNFWGFSTLDAGLPR